VGDGRNGNACYFDSGEAIFAGARGRLALGGGAAVCQCWSGCGRCSVSDNGSRRTGSTSGALVDNKYYVLMKCLVSRDYRTYRLVPLLGKVVVVGSSSRCRRFGRSSTKQIQSIC
jgi:hypothetical protein